MTYLKLLLRCLQYNTETATCFDSQGAIIVEWNQSSAAQYYANVL
jgi:hypothetical protein